MDIQAKTKEVIENFISKGWPFTSLDVSNAVKNSIDRAVRHRDVAPVVRQLFAAGIIIQNGYERELISVTLSNGDQKQAFLYHHWSTSANAYTDRCQEPVVPKLVVDESDDNVMLDDTDAIDVAKSDLQGAAVISQASDEVKRAQKSDHRLEVPASWVNDMDWDIGEGIYAIKDNNSLVLKHVDDVISNDDVVGTMVISNDCRLRITKKVLDRVFQSSSAGNELMVSKNAKTITVDED